MPDHRDILGAEFEVFNDIVDGIENVKPELLKERWHRGRHASGIQKSSRKIIKQSLEVCEEHKPINNK